MDIARVRRGFFMPSSHVSRCPSYSQCVSCGSCQNFDQYAWSCKVCIQNLADPSLMCSLHQRGHDDATQAALRSLFDALGMTLYHPDRKMQTINHGTIEGTRQERVLKALEDINVKYEVEDETDG